MKLNKISTILLLCAIVTLSYAGESVSGNEYSGEDSDNDFYKYKFLNNGTLKYTGSNGTFENATWQQYKSSIFIEKNNNYSNVLV